MTTNELRDYRKARKLGYSPRAAGSIARTISAWDKFDYGANDDRTLVRMVAEPENESYFNVYGEPDGYTDVHGRRISAEQERANIICQIDLNGCWYVKAQWRPDADSDWEDADGDCGMCIYEDPTSIFENCYVEYMMRSAVKALREQVGYGIGI